jgi:CRP/FNR family transcriptional regulator
MAGAQPPVTARAQAQGQAVRDTVGHAPDDGGRVADAQCVPFGLCIAAPHVCPYSEYGGKAVPSVRAVTQPTARECSVAMVHPEALRVVSQRLGSLPAPCAGCDVRERNFCAALEPQEIVELTRILTEAQVPAHGTLFREGEPADYVMNITRGAVKLYKLLADGRRQILGFRFAGDFIGLTGGPEYAYSVEALTETRVCRFQRRKLDALRERMRRIDKRLLELSIDELTGTQEQLVLLGRKHAEEKLVSFLLLLGQAQVRRGEPGEPIALPMNRSDIADYLGLTIETVSRTFTTLRKRGLIALDDTTHVRVLDRATIEDMAAGSA